MKNYPVGNELTVFNFLAELTVEEPFLFKFQCVYSKVIRFLQNFSRSENVLILHVGFIHDNSILNIFFQESEFRYN